MGERGVERIVRARRYGALRLGDLGKIVQSVRKLQPFITCVDWQPGFLTDSIDLRARLAPKPQQLSLF